MTRNDRPAAEGRVVDAVVEVSTGPVFYRDSGGNGVPMVFLHAASGNSMTWEHQIPAFLAAGYRFIAIDYRGADRKSGARDWSDQIHALVTRLALDRFHLLGTALGGGTAFQYVLAYPQKVRSLVIANSHGNVTDEDYVEMGKRIRPSPQFEALPVDFRELGPSYRAANPAGAARWLAVSRRKSPVDSAPVSSAAEAEARFTLKPERAVTWAKLEALAVPTLLIAGDADLYMPPSVLRMFTARMSKAESAVIPETGHSSYWEDPEAFNRIVLGFIAKH
ncbi:MAG TPA: alpha/beta hydrolase [Burkholderiales bacterium]|nr:alpha/beta hydrolase [Burkholderiales bacterium]